MKTHKTKVFFTLTLASILAMSTAYAASSSTKGKKKAKTSKAAATNQAKAESVSGLKLPAGTSGKGTAGTVTVYSTTSNNAQGKATTTYQVAVDPNNSKTQVQLVTADWVDNELSGWASSMTNTLNADTTNIGTDITAIQTNATQIGADQNAIAANSSSIKTDQTNIATNRGNIVNLHYDTVTTSKLLKQTANMVQQNTANISSLKRGIGGLSFQLIGVAKAGQKTAANLVKTDEQQAQLESNQESLAVNQQAMTGEIATDYQATLQNASNIVMNAGQIVANTQRNQLLAGAVLANTEDVQKSLGAERSELHNQELSQSDIRDLQHQIFSNTSALGSRSSNFGTSETLARPNFKQTQALINKAQVYASQANTNAGEDYAGETANLYSSLANLYSALGSRYAENNPAFAQDIENSMNNAYNEIQNSYLLWQNSGLVVARAQAGDIQAMAAVNNSTTLQKIFNSNIYANPFRKASTAAGKLATSAGSFNPKPLITQLQQLQARKNYLTEQYVGTHLQGPTSVGTAVSYDQITYNNINVINEQITNIKTELQQNNVDVSVDENEGLTPEVGGLFRSPAGLRTAAPITVVYANSNSNTNNTDLNDVNVSDYGNYNSVSVRGNQSLSEPGGTSGRTINTNDTTINSDGSHDVVSGSASSLTASPHGTSNAPFSRNENVTNNHNNSEVNVLGRDDQVTGSAGSISVGSSGSSGGAFSNNKNITNNHNNSEVNVLGEGNQASGAAGSVSVGSSGSSGGAFSNNENVTSDRNNAEVNVLGGGNQASGAAGSVSSSGEMFSNKPSAAPTFNRNSGPFLGGKIG